jgi:hypothetical protein
VRPKSRRINDVARAPSSAPIPEPAVLPILVKKSGNDPIIRATHMDLDGDQHSRHRTVVDEQRRAELLADYKQSGLTQREYTQQKGIDYNTFGAWLWQQQHRRAAPASEPRPASVIGPSSGRLEVMLPNKIVVRGDDPSAIASIIQALRQVGAADGPP